MELCVYCYGHLPAFSLPLPLPLTPIFFNISEIFPSLEGSLISFLLPLSHRRYNKGESVQLHKHNLKLNNICMRRMWLMDEENIHCNEEVNWSSGDSDTVCFLVGWTSKRQSCFPLPLPPHFSL